VDEQRVADNVAKVRRVCESWATLTREEWQELMAPDVDYRNIPIEGDHHVGPDAVFEVLSRFSRSWHVALRVDTIVGDERAVLTERTEHFEHRAGSKPTFDLPVMGAVELKDGKITAWRDYFDLAQLRLR
jgi:limonene-1,2-epoxide hydrolase